VRYKVILWQRCTGVAHSPHPDPGDPVCRSTTSDVRIREVAGNCSAAGASNVLLLPFSTARRKKALRS
jgi:hypothetical protein